MTTSEHPMVRKIRLLQAKAQDASVTEAERDALNRKIAELSAKYGIDQVRDVIDGADDEMVLKEFEINLAYADCHARLLYRIMEAIGCRAILTTGEGDAEVTVVGYLSSIERGELLYTSLSLQMAAAVDRFAPRGYRATRSYLSGFADGAGQVLREAEAAARADADREDATAGRKSTSLVLVTREQAVTRAFKTEFPHVTASRRSTVDYGAYGAGAAAGRQANLGTGSRNVCQPQRTALR